MSFFYQNRQEQLYLYLSKNNPYAVHLHRQLELIYVLSGSTTVTVEQQDFLLTPGQGVLVFPNQMHGLKHVEPGQNLLCIFEPDFCHSFRHFSRTKSLPTMTLPPPPCQSTAVLPCRDLKHWPLPWKRIVPHLPMYKSMRKGISHSCWQTCCHRCLCKCVKTQMTWNWSKDCFSIWMPTIPKNCPWKVSRKNSVSAALSCPGSSLRNSTPLFLIT